jgi:peptidoglycan/xylan/chitin deacetylase (PgdA/CDA1 family)
MRGQYLVPWAALALVITSPSMGMEPTVAIHVSENTQASWRYTTWKSFHAHQFLREALKSDGTPFVELTDADIAAGRLREASGAIRYPILFSLGAEAISDMEASQLRAYVQEGGHIYVGGSAWSRYEDGRPRLDSLRRPTSALAAEMGLSGGGWTRLSHINKQVNDAMVDHLPPGTSEWQMPPVYSYLDIWTPHWVWTARPSATSSATVVLQGVAINGFQVSSPNPPVIPDAANATYRIADIDGDGSDDLAFRLGSSIYVRLSNGQNLRPAAFWSHWNTAYDFHLADVNGDGRADLIGRSGIDVQVGLSTGTSFAYSTRWTVWGTDYDLLLGDVNGDGRADLVGRSPTMRDVQVGLSTGAAFATSTRWAPYDGGTAASLADVNGDQRLDLVFRVGTFIQVRRSTGASFGPLETWSYWSTAYDLRLGDVDGDGRADAVGRLMGNESVEVGLSTGSRFAVSSRWTIWHPNFFLSLGDVNGDGRRDAVGVKINLNAPAHPAALGELHVALSAGMGLPGPVKLASKAYGSGVFTYNAEPVPLAGYGGFANDNSEYKTMRVSIERAFAQHGLPLVTLSPWPFPSRAAFIYRHDHFLSQGVHQLEQQFAGASASHPFGEYYLMPELGGAIGACGQPNDYPAAAPGMVAAGAILGAHVKYHVQLDDHDYSGAVGWLQTTVNEIQAASGGRLSPVFVAPVYRAVKRSSMLAIRDMGFLTTGEQGMGPFPHFSVDPENDRQYLGAVLQLPVSEWPGFDNIERMSVDPENIRRAASLSHALGGLINVYDHVGSDAYAAACTPTLRVDLARVLLQHVQTLPGVWTTNSLQIRNWWLQKERRQITASFSRPSATTAVVDVQFQTRPPMAPTSFSADPVSLRITLDTASQALLASGIRVTLNGVNQPGSTCTDQPDIVRCEGGDLRVRIGAADQVRIQLGAL